MKIGILTAFYPDMIGGAEASLEVLLKSYRLASVPHILFTLNGTKGRMSSDLVPIPHFTHVPRKAKVGGFPILDEMVGRQLPQLLRQHGVDLLHVVDTYSVCGGVKAAIQAGVPTVLTCQNNIGTPYKSFGVRFPVNRWLDARERQVVAAIKKCNMTIAVSNFIAGQLVAAGVSASRIKTVYVPGIMADWPEVSQQHTHQPLRILALGRLYRDKGFHVLLLAAARLAAENRQFQVIIAGRGPYARALLRLSRNLELGERIRFVGHVPRDKIPQLLDWSDVIVVPTIISEPFPRAGVEAMSRGKPLIGSAVGGIPELVADGETGFLVNPNEPEAIAQRLAIFADRPDITERMGHLALARCRERFDSSVIVRQLVGIYEEAAASRANYPS